MNDDSGDDYDCDDADGDVHDGHGRGCGCDCDCGDACDGRDEDVANDDRHSASASHVDRIAAERNEYSAID